MRLISWNVNGLRATMKKGFVESVQKMDPDILGLQETKTTEAKAGLDFPDYPYKYYYPAESSGRHGTALFSRIEPLNVQFGLGHPEHDDEGRVISAEFDDFYFVTVYTPNSGRGLPRLDYRVKQWDPAFVAHLKNLEQSKPVVFCGDLNVAHQEIDIARPSSNRRTAGFTNEERESFTRILDQGFIDTFRALHPDQKDIYSFWSIRGGARARNVGWRLDYFCVSEDLMPQVQASNILNDIMGSDHCPVELILD
ncbi:MAG: exodeoxyribonuclease III [Myxococcota bacterium]